MGFWTHSALEVTGAVSTPLSVPISANEIAVVNRFMFLLV